MSFWSDLLRNSPAILKAWLDARSAKGGGSVPEVTSTVVAKIGGGDLTYGHVQAVVNVVDGLSTDKLKAILNAKTGTEAIDATAVVGEDLVAVLGALGIIPGAALSKLAIEGFVYLIEHNGQGPDGFQYPPVVYSGRSQRPPA